MKNLSSILLLTLVGASFAGCAHQSSVTPSNGHIDGQSNPSQPSSTSVVDIPRPVKTPAYLPPPKAKAKEQTYSVVVNDVPVKEILFALARESKLNVDINSGVQGRVTLNAVDQTLPAILERLSKQVDLTYKIENNVLYVGPDLPVLRTYQIDYVNMTRDTSGYIGAAAEIATTGRSNATGTTSTTSSGTGGASNSSRTGVVSESKNRFWETLIQNVKDILAETDKEVVITRLNGDEEVAGKSQSTPDVNQANNTASGTRPDGQKAITEYKTLFAAKVIANPETGVITVRATNKQHEKIQEFLDKILSSAKRQVLIEASIVEVTLNDTYQAGIDWSRVGNGFQLQESLGTSSLLSPTGVVAATGTPSPFSIGYATGGLNLSLRLLQQFGDTKVLSSPKLMVLNNQTAVLKVVDNLVYFTIEAQTNANQTNTQTTFTTTPHSLPVGVVMSVTPQINSTKSVMLDVRPTISRSVGSVSDPNPSLRTTNATGTITNTIDSRIPIIRVREMESVLRVNSGDTAVLGGLMQDEIQRAKDEVPGIAKIPLFGKLFTARSDYNVKTELVIFLRPIVVENASLESDELKSYKQYLPTPELSQKLDESTH